MEKFSTPPQNHRIKSWDEIKSTTTRKSILFSSPSSGKKKAATADRRISKTKSRQSLIFSAEKNYERRRSYNNTSIIGDTTMSSAISSVTTTNTSEKDTNDALSFSHMYNNQSQQQNDDSENIPPETHRVFEFGVGDWVVQSRKIVNLSRTMQLYVDSTTTVTANAAGCSQDKSQKEKMIESKKTPSKPTIPERLMEKITRDLNSPSASAQMRARNALK